MIVNSKLLGIDRKLKGSSRDIFKNLLVMKLAKIRFRNLKIAVERMEKVKSKFRYWVIYLGWKSIIGKCSTNDGNTSPSNLALSQKPNAEPQKQPTNPKFKYTSSLQISPLPQPALTIDGKNAHLLTFSDSITTNQTIWSYCTTNK